MNNPKPESASQLFLSLVRDILPHSFNSALQTLDHQTKQSYCALWLQSGEIEINNKTITQGCGIHFAATDIITVTSVEPVVILRFIASTKPIDILDVRDDTQIMCETLYTQAINAASTEMILRLDQVDFPPTAIAYKHTHPGPGIRHLVEGGLTLVSDHGEQIISAGDAWFEDANSAVEARAVSTEPSRFIRTMLLPLEYEGRSTFTLYNESDAEKPTLQTNIRHFEKRISLDDSH